MKKEKTDFKEMIDFNLKTELDKLQNFSSRNPQNTARGRSSFLIDAQDIWRASSQSPKSHHIGWPIPLYWSKNQPVHATRLATILMIFSLAIVVVTATIVAAQYAVPNQLLYKLKLDSENTRGMLTFQPQTRFELALQFADRRIMEVERLHQKGITPPETLVDRYEFQILSAFHLAANMNQEDIAPALLQLQQTLLQQEQIISRLQIQNPGTPLFQQMMLMIQSRLQLAAGGIKDPNEFRDQVRSDQDEIPSRSSEMTMAPLAGTKTTDTHSQMSSPRPSTSTNRELPIIRAQTEPTPPTTVTAAPTSITPTQTTHPYAPLDP